MPVVCLCFYGTTQMECEGCPLMQDIKALFRVTLNFNSVQFPRNAKYTTQYATKSQPSLHKCCNTFTIHQSAECFSVEMCENSSETQCEGLFSCIRCWDKCSSADVSQCQAFLTCLVCIPSLKQFAQPVVPYLGEY